MRHRSEWFLSDPTGLVTVKCRPDRPSSLGPNQLTPPPLTPSPAAATASPGQIAAMTAAYLSASAAASTTPSRHAHQLNFIILYVSELDVGRVREGFVHETMYGLGTWTLELQRSCVMV